MAMTEERVVRISLSWFLVALAGIFVVGMAGGFLAAWWREPAWSGLPDAQDRFITTIQEVTISPNTAATELAARQERSIVLIARENQLKIPAATGIMATSDGVVATTASLPEDELVMLDSVGRATKLERIGTDVLYGITYLRAAAGVFAPMEVREDPIAVGSTLIALSRSPESVTLRVSLYAVEEYRLPISGEPAGWQQLMSGTPILKVAAAGSALLDDEGRVAGLIIPGNDGQALPGPALKASLQRLAQNQLDANPFAERGFSGDYAFVTGADETQVFTMVITAVTPNSPASVQGLKAGDTIESIHGAPVTWQQSIAEQFTTKEAVPVQVRRGEDVRVLTL